jgi:hypothetical protein
MRTDKLKLALIMLCVVGCLIATLVRTQPSAAQAVANPAALPAAQVSPTAKDYSKFLHKDHAGQVKVPGTSQTRNLDCAYCHERNPDLTVAQAEVGTTKRNQRLQIKFPSHKACTECHIQQFTAQPLQTCTICHDNQQGLSARPPQRDFPRRYDFNSFFDSAQHAAHTNYKAPGKAEAIGCAFCHKSRSKPAALSIGAHNECYVCHAPNSGDQKAAQKSGCNACHTQMAESPAPYSVKYTSRAWGAQFTHAQHAGQYGIACSQCHTVQGGYNQPVPTSIKTKQHLSNAERSGKGCFSCHDGSSHNGRNVFSGEDFGSCDKCHTRADKKVFAIPG